MIISSTNITFKPFNDADYDYLSWKENNNATTLRNVTIKDKDKIILDNLKPCTEYEMELKSTRDSKKILSTTIKTAAEGIN